MATEFLGFNTRNKVRLKSTLYAAGFESGGMMLFFSPDDAVSLDFMHLYQRDVIAMLDGTKTIAEIYQALLAKGVEVTREELAAYIQDLSKARLLEEEPWDLPSPELERYDRQIRFFAAGDSKGMGYGVEVQRRLGEARVTLIGLGGFGSHVLGALAAMGVGNIRIVDHDVVEITNLARKTIYTSQDLGRLKVQAAREYVRSQNPGIRVDGIEKQITSEQDVVSLVPGSDLVIFLADSPRHKIFHWMNEACFETGIPTLFSLGVTMNLVRVGPLVIPGKTACFACALPDQGLDFEHPLARRHNARAVHGVIVPYVMSAAGFLGMEALRFLGGIDDLPLMGRVMTMNMHTFATDVRDVKSRTGCPICG